MKRFIAVMGSAALALALIAPFDQATAEEGPPSTPDTNSKAVQESDTGSYIVVMDADPLIASIDPAQLDTPAGQAATASLDASHDAVLAEEGVSTDAKVQDFTNALNGFSARLDYDQAVALAGNPKVARVVPDELRHATNEDDGGSSAPGSGSNGRYDHDGGRDGHDHGNGHGDGHEGDDDPHDQGSTKPDDLGRFLGLTGKGRAWASGLTGEGVVVGVIDTGIWPEHPSFADDGTYPAHAPLDATVGNPCAFGNSAANPNDAPFACNNKLIGAREMLTTYKSLIGLAPDEFDSARDDEGHGTHTASTAAGDANVQATIFGRKLGRISGIAPRAQIVAYKALGNLGGFTSDLAAAIDQAVADGVDVINYSIGGGAQLWSADTSAFLGAAAAGVFTAVSAGNDGPTPGTIGGPADVPWVTAVGANTQRRFFQGVIELKDGQKIKGASITPPTPGALPLVDAANAGSSDLCLANTLDPAKVTGKVVLCRRGGNGRVAKSAEVHRAGGAGMILYNTTDADNLFTDNFWVPTVHINNTDGLKVKQYIARARKPRAELEFDKITQDPAAPSMTIFSSRGPNPTAPDIIKPDLTAPGLQVLAGASPFTDAGFVPGQLFQAIAGTSMSSPVVAGIYALLKQAHPDWSAAMAKSALMSTANTNVLNNDRVSPAGPFDMGAGMVDPGQVALPGTPFNPGLVYDAGLFEYAGFLCDQAPQAFPNPVNTCNFLRNAGIPTTAANLNYPSIGIAEVPGAASVTRTVTSVADTTVTYTAAVNPPPGYSVDVQPSTITLAPGAKASFTVTVTNAGAPVDAWQFGDITWLGAGYHVRSPLALKGVQLSAPASITGTGTDGTASFDVRFGYSGAYSADPHGLVAATPNNGTVFQDPDQTPFTADDGQGLIALPFTITDAALARWSLKIPGADDLDLYLRDSAGNLVAQSTNGGTDERIQLLQPGDDTYTLYVHGWAVGNPAGLNFSVQSWIVPNAGATLTVTAPTQAVIGTTGTVTAGWSGLAAGQSYVGAITHSDGASIIGTTVVDVTT